MEPRYHVTKDQTAFLNNINADIVNYDINREKIYKLGDLNEWLWEFYRIIIEVQYYGVNNFAYELKGSQLESSNNRYCLQGLTSPNEALRIGFDKVIELINSKTIISEAERLLNDMIQTAEENRYDELYREMADFRVNNQHYIGSEFYRNKVLGDFQNKICKLIEQNHGRK